jgi:hypothetical protein
MFAAALSRGERCVAATDRLSTKVLEYRINPVRLSGPVWGKEREKR